MILIRFLFLFLVDKKFHQSLQNRFFIIRN